MKPFLVFLFVLCLLAAGCSQRTPPGASSSLPSESSSLSAEEPANQNSDAEESSSLSAEEPANQNSDAEESSSLSAEEPANQNSDAEESTDPADSSATQLGSFSFLLPPGAIVVDNAVYISDSDLPQVLMELSAVNPVLDAERPFFPYDELYTEAEKSEESTFGGFPGKSYFLQEEVTEGGMSGFKNTIVYCICVDDQVAVITYYPARGVGGIHEQRKAFEAILDTIKPAES